MRELKFRIWMNGRYNDKDEWIHIDTEGNVCIPQCYNEDCCPLDDQSIFLIEQYTGLKDKNGKEIYEGDIVLFEDHCSEEPEIGIGNIEFEEGIFCVNWPDSGFQPLNEVEVKIIGNIHENPELLENK